MLIIGIAGGSGSGKTTVVKEVMSSFSLNQVSILSQDSYYKDSSHITIEDRKSINFDHPASIEFDLLVNLMHQLRKGFNIEQPLYLYITSTRRK